MRLEAAQQNCPSLRPKGRLVVSIGRPWLRPWLRPASADSDDLSVEGAPIQGQFSRGGSSATQQPAVTAAVA